MVQKFTLQTFSIFILGLILTVNTPTVSIAQGSTIDHWEMVVNAYDNWHYFLGTQEPPSGWNSTTFNDSSWDLGPGGIGYDDGDDATIIPQVSSVYMRQSFNVSNTNQMVSALFAIDYDDGFVAYLNGTEIARGNLGLSGQATPYNTYADTYTHEAQLYQGGEPESFAINSSTLGTLLVQGTNVLAVQVHNCNATSSDLSAIPFLFLGTTSSIVNTPTLPSWFNAGVFDFSSHLPLFLINTNGQSIVDEPRITAQLQVIDNGPNALNYLVDSANAYDGQISIEIRGNSSQMFPKKSYSFETQNSDSSNNNVSLLGMPEENDWILHGPYSDKTLLRNVITYQLAREMGNYATRTEFCEVIINNDYRGLYILMEKRKQDKNRVDIDEIDLDDNSGDSITGGYLLAVDWRDGEVYDWISPVNNYNGNYLNLKYQYDYPDREDITSYQENYIQNHINLFEYSLEGNNFAHPHYGYRKYIDIPSFIDFFIAQEITHNVDGYRLSTSFTKTRDSQGGKYFAGPIWDFNLGYGNADYGGCWNSEGWALYNPYVISVIPFYWKRLEDDPTYEDLLRCRWDELRQTLLDTSYIFAKIDSLVTEMGPAIDRNFERWNVLGTYVWPNYYVGNSYPDEIVYLKSWINQRFIWIDQNLAGNSNSCKSFYEDQIIVSEINYDSGPNYETGDWFEIKNIGSSSIDLSGWTIKDENNLNTFTIPLGTQLDTGAYLVVAHDQAKFSQVHPLLVNILGNFGWKLGDNDKIRLYDVDGWPVFTVNYDNDNGWPQEADGDGPTLEIVSETGNLNSASNWFAGCPGGSPGGPYTYPCPSIGVQNHEFACLKVYPNPASNRIWVSNMETKQTSIQFLTMQGKLLESFSSMDPIIEINIENVARGCYFLKINTVENSYVKKITKIE